MEIKGKNLLSLKSETIEILYFKYYLNALLSNHIISIGCGCRNTEFGCCSDEETPALGPNREGCGCASSKFGCCVDGVTEAKGENFESCDTVPENLQGTLLLIDFFY